MAYQLDGSTQHLRVSNPINAYPYTIGCWAYTNNTSQRTILTSPCSSTISGNYEYMVLDGSGKIEAQGGGNNAVVGNTSISSSTWFHATCIISSAASQVFLNGTLDGSLSINQSIYSSMDRLGIGVVDRASPALFFQGLIAEVAVWNVALTASEIASLGKGFTPDQIRPQSLAFYAPLLRDLIDVRGGRIITNVGSATVATHPRIIT